MVFNGMHCMGFVARRMDEIMKKGALFLDRNRAIQFFETMISHKIRNVNNMLPPDTGFDAEIDMDKSGVPYTRSWAEGATLSSKIALLKKKNPHTIPSSLNLYFDPTTPRCVEATFATYVIMLCYDFENGGLVPGAEDSRFAEVISSLGLEKVPVSMWDYDELQHKMLAAIRKVCKLERELATLDLSDPRKRPWFVM